jgi:hypothetical protein
MTYAQIRPPKCSFSHDLTKKGNHIANIEPRPNLPFSIKTSSGFATVHYTNVGINAVPAADENNNAIPDYVEAVCEALEYSYDVIVNELGYPPPIADNLGPDTSLDVYLTDMFPLYGATYPDALSGGTHLFSPTFLKIDNDFTNSGFYTKGIDAVKVTVAHELHHVIQYAHYGVTANNTRKIYEMYSTYIETIVYPEIPDYISYVQDLFSNTTLYPFGDGNPNSGYHWSIFAIMLAEKYGDSLFKTMWNNIKKGNLPYQALDSALMQMNSSIAKEFKSFFTYCYYTDYRAAFESSSKFKNASDLPLLKPYQSVDSIFTKPSFIHNGTLKPFELRMFTVQLPKEDEVQRPDTFSLICSNFDVESMYKGMNTPSSYDITILKGASPIPTIGNLPYQLLTNLTYEYFLQTSSEFSNKEFAYPMPFVKKLHSILYFPVSNEFSRSKDIELTILTSDGVKVASFVKQITFQNNSQQVQLFGGEIESLNVGVYIGVIHQDEHQKVLKIIIR